MASSNTQDVVDPPRHSPVLYPEEEHNSEQHPHVPKTHTSPGVIQLFKSLTLKAKLKMCKDIEDQNDERHKKSILHTTDPQSHPDPGSETASMFTIDDEDLRRLKHPYFPQIMFDTEHCGMIPLPLFLNSSLLYITVNAASVPTFKANPKPDEKKGSSVIDCKKLLAHLNLAELEIDKVQWAEASYNCFRFHCERDIINSGGAYSAWWDHHFNFFNLQMDKNEYYDAWKTIELELRQEFYARPCTYDANHYVRKYDIVKCIYDLKRQMQSTLPTSTTSLLSSQVDSSKSSPLPCCVLCGVRGHTLDLHSSDSTTKFPDDNLTWAKYSNRILQTPDGKIICIGWNVGSGAPCNHGGKRVHLCSFCGGDHHAFSWTCRTKPDDI
ncbi:hypothetical protein GALMADRAFT_126978 [Galerina marginata CBS 339.88]|uniref:Uncharacterized protein n=1 Tax=Galerina marginata (strain CBS 339.88) TaxID=685588 RepID=A0A067SKV7_GALM3|nr:hypothetical protein GALMADRAFT_126978 [Galerina marginata CBS 339.88]